MKSFDPDETQKLISSSDEESSSLDEEVRPCRTRKFKCDNSSGLIVTNDMDEKEEMGVRIRRRMNNTQKYRSDSDTMMLDGNSF